MEGIEAIRGTRTKGWNERAVDVLNQERELHTDKCVYFRIYDEVQAIIKALAR